ncbi:MAG: hypothetical protein NVSMB26_15500 [Beijerinckiaceae bacterium]
MKTTILLVRSALPVLVLGLGLSALSGPARADCQEDLGKIMQRREAQIQELNASAKATKGKLDPVTSCPKLKKLAALEGELVSYMTKNKDWCSIPDEAIANATTGRGKTGQVAAQACNIAAQMKKAQEQQAAGNMGPAVQKLPAGPL